LALAKPAGVPREVSECLHREGTLDASGVAEIVDQSRCRAVPLAWGQRQSWQHLGEVPADLLLRSRVALAEQP
jgi:hypothetical protein